MTELVENDENFGMVPPSTGKKKKARRVFGSILANSDLNHSLSYTPSPAKKGTTGLEKAQSPSKLVTNLFSIEETGSQAEATGGRKSEMSSSRKSTCRSESSTVVVNPFSNIIGGPDNNDEDCANVPKSIRVPSEKSSTESKLSVENVPFYSKKERLAKTMKPHRTNTGLRPPMSSLARVGIKTATRSGRTGSANQAINASRSAREKTLKEKAKAAAAIRGQWKEEKDEALEFYEESEKLRREQLNLQNQLSSNYSRTKAQRNLNKRQAKREKIEKEAIFKSDVAREQREKLKEMEDQRRRESVAVRAKIRANNREGIERMIQIQKQKEQAIHEESHASSQAFQQYQRDCQDSARKNYQFKRGDALRIRELHGDMERKRKEEEHESFELKMAALRDEDSYRGELAQQRRQSLESRNAYARDQRETVEEIRTKQKQAEHEGYELKRAAEKDAEKHKRDLEDERRASLAFRGEEAKRQREILSTQAAEKKKADHDSSALKFQADKDVEAYKLKEANLRRKSLEQRGATARGIRQKHLQDEGKRQEKEHESWALKFAGDKDAEEYHRKMAEKRRQSLQQRNEEARHHREVEGKQRAKAAQATHEGYELKWEGERDAEEYLRRMEKERRDSLNLRNLEAHQQREQALDQRSADRKAEHERFELKRAANKDVDEYRRKMEQERREDLAFQNKEKARHAKVMDELATIAKEQEAESYALKWGGEEDAKVYQAKLEEERRNSIRFRNEEAKRHQELDDEMHRQALVKQHEDEELKAADHKDMQNYKDECAERDRASLEFRGKETTIRRLEELNAMRRKREAEEISHQLEALARMDVQEYVKECKSQRRKSLAMRAKEKRRHAKWVRQEEQREIEQRAYDSRLRARDGRSMELARQKERTAKALDALRHAKCTFSSFPESY